MFADGIATLSDGSTLLVYGGKEIGQLYKTHVVRIPTDGISITDVVVPELLYVRQLAVHGDEVLALSIHYDSTSGTARAYPVEARLLDGHGFVRGGPTFVMDASGARAVSTPTGFVVIDDSDDISVTPLAADGSPGARNVLAASYEVDPGGCNAAGARTFWTLPLVALVLVSRRRSPRKNHVRI